MTGLPRAVPVDQLEDLILCSICLETLNDPRTLHCFHSFCKVCLEKFVKSQRAKVSAEGKQIEEFNCPSCRSVFNLKPNEEVASMCGSHFIKNMLEIMAIKSQTKVTKCSRCEEPSCCRCVTCEIFMCKKCFEAHETWHGPKKHSVLTLDELTQPENESKIKERMHCSEHKNKKLKFYCETCAELICRYCMDFNHVRPDHVCLPIEKVAEKHKEALKTSFGFLGGKLFWGSEALQVISNTRQTLKKNAERAKEQIIRQSEKVKKTVLEKLEEKVQVKIQEVEKAYNQTLEQLTIQEDEMQFFVSKVEGSVNLSKNLLEKGNDEEIIASQRMMDERVENIKKECPKDSKPIHDGSIEYVSIPVEVAYLTAVLGKLGKVVCQPVISHQNHSPLAVNSVILKDKEEYVKQMEEWLKEHEFKWRLCYRASRDGWNGVDFHSKCSDKGPTVVLVKVDDYIFGGFTDQCWEETATREKRSTASFMFSLVNKDKLAPFKAPIRKGNRVAIVSHRDFGPLFGQGSIYDGHDLLIVFEKDMKSYCDFGRAFQLPVGYMHGTDKTRSLLAGSFHFTPAEMEVFY